MKKQVIVWLMLSSAIAAQAQIRKIPSEVTEAFKNRFPDAENVSWKDKLSSFQASFILDDVEMSADFNSNGEWQKTEKTISFEELPDEVVDGFSKSKYAEWEKGSVVEIDDGSESFAYRILVKKSAISKKYLYFDSDGRLKKESITL